MNRRFPALFKRLQSAIEYTDNRLLKIRCKVVQTYKLLTFFFPLMVGFTIKIDARGELHSNSGNLTVINKLQFRLILQSFVLKVAKN